MAEGKLDPPEDLGPTATRPAVEPLESKGSAAGGNEIDKVLTGVLEEVKDQATPENIIPLSPQWLYAKPTETKMGISAALGDTRAPNPLPQGTLAGSTQKDARRLDVSQDKKEWRRNVPDLESARRWREEERETGLLSRRERRKEGDRENEFRKSDRRSDSISMREPADSRTSSASDRRHDAAGRSSVQEGRRDTKWSSRWGPEDKEKDSKTEKKVDTDKEDPHVDKQSVLAVNRPLAESDARDKWRPRHRQEGHSVGSTVYHAAPGFGTEKGRVDGSNAGFALGRGRPNITRDLPYSGSSSSGPIGTLPSPLVMNASLYGMSSLSANTFRYPRGKLLDIYGNCKIDSAFDNIERIEEGSPITQSNIIAPLAFVKPDPAEEVALVDISKNKVVSTDASYDSNSGRSTTVNDFNIEQLPGDGDCKTEDDALFSGLDLGGMTSAVVKDGSSRVIPCSPTLSEKKIGKTNMGGDNDGCGQTLDSQKDAISEAINSSDSLDVTYKLPDDSNSLFDTSFIKVPGTNIQHQNSSTETKPADQGIPADLSLFYLDPQGEIQGPFLAEDIISWYDEGFFGTDLPVCLSGATDGMVFQPLGKVIPDLSSRPQPNPSINHVDQSESSSTSIMNLQADASTPVAHDDRQIPSGDGSFNPQIQHKITDHGISVGSHYGQEAEEVLYTGRSLSSSMHSPTGKFANDLHNLSQASSSRRTPINETGHPNSSYHKVPTDYNVNPLGLTWSELEGTHQKGPLSSNIPGVGDQGRIINSLGGDGFLFSHKQEQFDLRDDSVHDAWPSNFGRNNSSDVIQDALDARQLEHFVPDSNQLNLENMLSQHFQEQQFQQQHLVSPHQNIHLTGSFMEQLQGPGHHQQMMNNRVPAEEHSLKLQFQQQRHLQQLEEQRHLQQLEEQRLLHQQQQQFHQQQLEEQLLLHQQLQQLHQQQQQQQQLEEQRLLLQQQQQLQQQQELHNQMQLVQQQQQQQLLMEQLLHRQLHDPSSRVSHVDPLHGENMLEEVLYKRHLLELQQQAQHAARNLDPSIDQLIQAKFGPNLHHDHHNEMLDALAHHSHNTKLPLEHQFLLSLQQEQQQQAHQFPISLRQHLSMEKERHADGLWSVDESGQFVRAAAMPHQSNSSMLGQLDFAQHSQRPSSFDHREGNFILHDQMQRNSQPFERPVGTHEPNMNFLNTLAQLQGMDVQERHSQMMNPGGHMTQLPSGSRSRQNWMPDHFPAACSDKLERSWTEPRGQLQNSLIESQFSHLHQLAEQQKREMLPNHIMEDQSRWTGKSESSNQLDLLDQKLVLESLQSSGPVDAPTQSYENREPSWLFPRSTKGSSYNLAADKMGSEGRQDPAGKLAVKASEIPSGRKETRVRRTSSYSETESTEASFTDMVKGTKKPIQDADASSAESLDVAPVGRSGKKKVKKGKQIDPSLLGFKVHSKRMLMGEIHRPDD